METYRFECQCYSFHHSIRMILDPEDGTIYFDVSMNQYLPWYKRVWFAIKYILGKNVNHYHDSTHLRVEDYDKIRELLNRSENICRSSE